MVGPFSSSPGGSARHTALAAFALALALGQLGPLFAAEECASCHEKEAKAEVAGVHGPSGITCVNCHGGDAEAALVEAAHSETKGFRGGIGRAENPILCGECHSDAAPMWEAGLRSDALALYRESAHGQAVLAEGRTEAATCIDCHSPVHGTPRSLAEGSPLRPEVVHDLCAKCHGDDALMD